MGHEHSTDVGPLLLMLMAFGFIFCVQAVAMYITKHYKHKRGNHERQAET